MIRSRCICASGRRRGFSLVEILLALGLFAAVGVISAYAYHSTMRLAHESTTAHNALLSAGHCLSALERDVWGAAELASIEPGGVRLTDGLGRTITWAWNEDRLVRRNASGTTEAWAFSDSATFAVEGPVVAVTVTDEAGTSATFRFASQLRLGMAE